MFDWTSNSFIFLVQNNFISSQLCNLCVNSVAACLSFRNHTKCQHMYLDEQTLGWAGHMLSIGIRGMIQYCSEVGGCSDGSVNIDNYLCLSMNEGGWSYSHPMHLPWISPWRTSVRRSLRVQFTLYSPLSIYFPFHVTWLMQPSLPVVVALHSA